MTHSFKPVVDRAEALALLTPSRRSELRERAHEVTERCVPKRFDFCSIINARAGSCTEDCKWCAQSARWRTGCAVHGWVGAEACVKSAKEAAANGAVKAADGVFGVAPGQSAVLYSPQGFIICGGTIEE